MGAQAAPELSQRAKEQFVDCSRVVIFDDKLQTLYSTYEVPLCSCVRVDSSLWPIRRPRTRQCLSSSERAYRLQAPQAELKALTQTFGDRSASISTGLVLQGKRFEARSAQGLHA